MQAFRPETIRTRPMSEPQLSIRSAKAKTLAHALARRTGLSMNRLVETALERYEKELVGGGARIRSTPSGSSPPKAAPPPPSPRPRMTISTTNTACPSDCQATARVLALDTSVIVAISLDEPEASAFKAALRNGSAMIGGPTLFETRIVLVAKGFANAREIVARLADAPNVAPVPFDREPYTAAESAFDRFGKSRQPASLNMGDCLAYAVAAVAKAPLLFKGRDFGHTDLAIHPASALAP